MVSSTMLRVSVVAALVSSAAGQVKVGGHVQDKYLKPFTVWATWSNTAVPNSVVTSFKTYAEATMEADVTNMTTAGHASYVDVLICPYTSGAVNKCVAAVNKAYVGPVMAWGGASDSIFDTACAALPNKNCFGFFTVGSKYMGSGLAAVDAKITATANVAIIINDNGFSRSVAAGAKATVAAEAGLTLQSETTISVKETALTAADLAKVKVAMDKKPDVVVIAGHNKDVEPTIIAIGKAVKADQNFPHAIIATNGVSQTANYGADSKYAKCVMMPTQWDSSTAAKDAVVKWDSAAFTAAMIQGTASTTASYQQAAAGAVGVAISNAMTAQSDSAKLVAALQAMDVDSFYGKLKWDSKGRIEKPMFTEQAIPGGSNTTSTAPTLTVVAPGSTAAAKLKFPLGMTDCWNFGTAAGRKYLDVAPSGTSVTSSAVLRFLSMPAVLSMVFAMLQ